MSHAFNMSICAYDRSASHTRPRSGLESRAPATETDRPRAFRAARGDLEHRQTDRRDPTGRYALSPGLGADYGVVRADEPAARQQAARSGHQAYRVGGKAPVAARAHQRAAHAAFGKR